MITISDIAKVCHETNRAYCAAIGDNTQRSWEEAEAWQRESAIAGVRWRIGNPVAPVSAQHEAWVDAKVKDGWRYGPFKDATAKTHPCMVIYAELPDEQKVKDDLFVAVVAALSPWVLND